MALYEPEKWKKYLRDHQLPPTEKVQWVTDTLVRIAPLARQDRDAYSHELARLHRGIARDMRLQLGPPPVILAFVCLCLSIQKRSDRLSGLTRHVQAAQPAPPDASRRLRGAAAPPGALLGVQRSAMLQMRTADKITKEDAQIPVEDRQYIDNQLRISASYWLEKADPLHRPWGDHWGEQVFREWQKNADTNGDFFAWVETHLQMLATKFPKAQYLLFEDRGVRYLRREEKFQYRVKFEDGLLFHRDRQEIKAAKIANRLDMAATKLDVGFWLFSTKDYSTNFNNDCFAIWVLSPTKKFYSHKHDVDRFHHSSFLAGGDMICGGEWAVSDGQLVAICDKTGHYLADKPAFRRACDVLLELKVDLTDVLYVTADYERRSWEREYYWLIDWYRHFAHGAASPPCLGRGQGNQDFIGAAIKESVRTGRSPKGQRAIWYAGCPQPVQASQVSSSAAPSQGGTHYGLAPPRRPYGVNLDFDPPPPTPAPAPLGHYVSKGALATPPMSGRDSANPYIKGQNPPSPPNQGPVDHYRVGGNTRPRR